MLRVILMGGAKLPRSSRRRAQSPRLAGILENGLLVLNGRPFLLNFSGFLQGDAVQAHFNNRLTAV
jgi:hypothetical protein